MRLKQEPGDFVVRELVDERYFKDRGRFRVYRVTKKKLTSLEAAMRLAELAGVAQADVGMAGLKDRQGVTTQLMSVKAGRPVFLKTPELRIEEVGHAARALESKDSRGNAFQITIRRVEPAEREALTRGIAEVKAYGLPNYFGEQRFGNLRHGQGWIARDLALGRHEAALRALLAAESEHDDARNARFKRGVAEAWGDWRACRELAGRFGQYISVFQHLIRSGDDFAGAFRYVKSQIRLIHLYAWQSHLWNRAVAAYVDEVVPAAQRFAVPSPEGRLVFARGELPIDPGTNGMFRLPGPGLEDVTDPRQRDLLALALRHEGLQPHEFKIEGVSGFQLKGEDRSLVVHPREMRTEDIGPGKVVVSFELPRGAYATLVMARVLPPGTDRRPSSAPGHELRDPKRARPAREDAHGTPKRRGTHPHGKSSRGRPVHGQPALGKPADSKSAHSKPTHSKPTNGKPGSGAPARRQDARRRREQE